MAGRRQSSSQAAPCASGFKDANMSTMSSAAEKAVEALELLPEEMREPAAAYLLSQAKKFRALKDAVDEGMADVEAGRVVPWDLEDFLKRAREQAQR